MGHYNSVPGKPYTTSTCMVRATCSLCFCVVYLSRLNNSISHAAQPLSSTNESGFNNYPAVDGHLQAFEICQQLSSN